jgi:hypothetical protein
MCEFFLENEIDKFRNEDDFHQFKKKIDEKLKNGTLIFVKEVFVDYGDYKINLFGLKAFARIRAHTYNLYKCLKCGRQWRLSMPENVWRGYLKPDSNK